MESMLRGSGNIMLKGFCATCLLLLCPFKVTAADQMTARFNADLTKVRVALCFDGQAPSELYRNAQAAAWSDGIYQDKVRLKTSSYGEIVRLPTLPVGACIHWQSDLRAALNKRNYRLIARRGQDLVMSADLWFWKGPRARDLLVTVKTPPSISFSTPWPTLDSADGWSRYHPDPTPARWETRLAIGTFKIQNIEVPGGRIRLAAVGNLNSHQQDKFRAWIKETALAIISVYGHFPQPQPQVLITPVGHRESAILHGEVIRGGGVAAIFMVDESRPLGEFTSDWTATHELSHMLLPYITHNDRWLSEGLASYYQNILRARNGRLSDRQAWQNLYAGFQRGEKNTHGATLARATRDGWHSTMRIYWSGAAMMLMADTRLRASSNGRQSLDTALQALSSCCMQNGRTWRAREMLEKLDQLTGTSIFTKLYRDHVYKETFPDLQSTWQDLGVDTRHQPVRFSDQARLATVRRSIMQG